VIIKLSDLFEATIDELLRSDEELKQKVGASQIEVYVRRRFLIGCRPAGAQNRFVDREPFDEVGIQGVRRRGIR